MKTIVRDWLITAYNNDMEYMMIGLDNMCREQHICAATKRAGVRMFNKWLG